MTREALARALIGSALFDRLARNVGTEGAIKDLARRATRAEQLFVDEYDARRDVERDRDELQARIVVLEAMR
jgi:hypothetical protein